MICDLAKSIDNKSRNCASQFFASDAFDAMTDECREVSWEAIARKGSLATLPLFLNPGSLMTPPTL